MGREYDGLILTQLDQQTRYPKLVLRAPTSKSVQFVFLPTSRFETGRVECHSNP